ncbi:THUMP domain-containing protein 1 [Mortierella sp. GBA35]|nr:THUMP domain-containing protein 1 [Mortierella sp. GBA35]
MGANKRKGAGGQEKGGKKAKVDIHKVGKYLPGGFPIDPKMKGVMVTCARGRETQAGKEACDLLSEYAQKLYGDDFNEDPAEQDEDESIEDAIAREVAQAKKSKGGKKYCMRFIPVDETSYANMEDIETMSERVFKPYFHAEDQKPTTFKIIPKIRHNDKVERDTLLKKLAGLAGQDQSHTVSMNDPEYIILAEVIKSICFLGVVRDYEKLKKYNIQSIFEAAQRSDDDNIKEERVVAPKESATEDVKKEEESA